MPSTRAKLATRRRKSPVRIVPIRKAAVRPAAAKGRVPIIIGHRGASGYVPEHTLVSYFLAIQQGADYAEPDLVMTKDGVLVCRHENEIGGTTDVATRTEFARRRTVKVVDGVSIEGWFTEDFTLAELKTLRARERIPEIRPANVRFDGQLEIPTFEELLGLLRALDAERAAAARRLGQPRPPRIGVYPETKHPTYFDKLGLRMDAPLLRALSRHGYEGRGAPVFIQSFEVGNLRRLRKKTALPMVQLIEASGAPYDFVTAGESRTYADVISPRGISEVAQYANAIGPNKSLVIASGVPTSLVEDAHEAGLGVHPWTFRAENFFLPPEYRSPQSPGGSNQERLALSRPAIEGFFNQQQGNLVAEIRAYLKAGVDGFFTDHPAIGKIARDGER